MTEEMAQVLAMLDQQIRIERESRNWLRFFGILTIISLVVGAAAVGLIVLDQM